MEKQHSAWRTLTSKIKDALFSYFGETELPAIKSSATPVEIASWKKRKEVASCYKKLFEPSSDDISDLVLVKIMERIFFKREDSIPNVQMAYAIAVCTTVLNPKYENIKLEKDAMKDQVTCYLVGFCKFVNCKLSNCTIMTFLFTKISFP